jgi:hypothetical protein
MVKYVGISSYMAESLKKSAVGLEDRHEHAESLANKTATEQQEIVETKTEVSKGIDQLGENSEEGQVIGGKAENAKESGGQTASQVRSQTTQIRQLPAVDIMIRETLEAIEVELKKTEDEIKILLKTKNASMQILNEKVKRARFLHGLIEGLKKAAKQAEDYIVGLWRQYVAKSS